MQAELFLNDLDEPWQHEQRRLAACMVIATAIVFLVLASLEWPLPSRLVPRLPAVLDVTLERPAARGASVPAARADVEPTPRAATPTESAASAEPVTAGERADRALPQSRPAERDAEVATPGTAAAAPVDWYAELERVAKEIGERTAREPGSMHPEFDELRRIAKLRYGPPRTNPPPPTWEVEKDLYGRTLLKKGNFFRVLDDMRLFNQEAFRVFERHMIFVSIPLGRAKPSNLPWVDTIRARYEYMREPDELPPLKAAAPAPNP